MTRSPTLLAITAALAMATAATAHDHPLSATLTGAVEVPGPGDADGSGSATVKIDAATGKVCYTLNVAKLDDVTMAHIHTGAVGVAGGVAVPLEAPVSGSSKACADVDKAVAAAILAKPADYYVNVHTKANPAGAVRGQLGH